MSGTNPPDPLQPAADAEQVVNPRLIDGFRLNFNQDDVPFAVPHLKEDLPFSIDPFLLWKSQRTEYKELHTQLTDFLQLFVEHAVNGQESKALSLLLGCREARELGLGYGRGTKAGTGIGPGLARSALDILRAIPQVADGGVEHIELLGLVVPLIAEDRISDITASILRRFFIDFSVEQARLLDIPMQTYAVDGIWDYERKLWTTYRTALPFNPLNDSPILLAPLDLLRHLPWINYEDYYRSSYSRVVLPPGKTVRHPKEHVLEYNRRNYVAVERYMADKEVAAPACRADPLFSALGLPTLRKKLKELQALPTGRDDNADKKYEELAYDLLASLLYPELEFASNQVRTDSGAHIRDVIFYNDGKTPFLSDLRTRYSGRQLVFELKNVAKLSGEHVNQLYRYMDNEFGHVGFLVTRRALPNNVRQNVVDLHSSKRCSVVVLDDTDLHLMISLLESGRRPIEAIKKKYIEFTRWLPK